METFAKNSSYIFLFLIVDPMRILLYESLKFALNHYQSFAISLNKPVNPPQLDIACCLYRCSPGCSINQSQFSKASSFSNVEHFLTIYIYFNFSLKQVLIVNSVKKPGIHAMKRHLTKLYFAKQSESSNLSQD
jgi:hypothetical protein